MILNNDTLQIEDGNYVLLTDNVNDADYDPTNEFQVVSLINDTIYLSNGGFVYIGGYLDNTDEQNLTLSNDTLYIENGNYVLIADSVNDADANPTNEIQTLSFDSIANSLSISSGNSVVIPINNSGTDDQNLTGANITNDTLQIDIENGNSTQVDLSPYNQYLEMSNDTIYLRPGNSFVIYEPKNTPCYTCDGF